MPALDAHITRPHLGTPTTVCARYTGAEWRALQHDIVERTRAMLYDAKLEDLQYWTEAALTTTYVKSRSPRSQDAKTPWRLLQRSKPDISGMRVFGAKAYTHVPKQLRRELDPLSTNGTSLGTPKPTQC